MNNIKIILLLFFIVVCSTGKAQKSYIYLAPLDSSTPYSISCGTFLDSFGGSVKKIKLNKNKKDRISFLIKSLDKINIKPYFNVRYMGEFYTKKQKFTFCGDEASICVNGINYKTSKDLYTYIRELDKDNL